MAGELAAEANAKPPTWSRTPFVARDDVPEIGSSPQFERPSSAQQSNDRGSREHQRRFRDPDAPRKREPRIPDFEEVKDKVAERVARRTRPCATRTDRARAGERRERGRDLRRRPNASACKRRRRKITSSAHRSAGPHKHPADEAISHSQGAKRPGRRSRSATHGSLSARQNAPKPTPRSLQTAR